MESQVRAAHSHFSVLLKLRGLTVFSAFVRGFKAHAESLKSTGFQAFGYEVKEFDAFRAPCCRRNLKVQSTTQKPRRLIAKKHSVYKSRVQICYRSGRPLSGFRIPGLTIGAFINGIGFWGH